MSSVTQESASGKIPSISGKVSNKSRSSKENFYSSGNENLKEESSIGSNSSDESLSEEDTDLRFCEAREYIQATVAKPLLSALAIVERERSSDPITYIAKYLLSSKLKSQNTTGKLSTEEELEIEKEIQKE